MQMTKLENAQSVFWEMHKDAYGFRPRGIDTSTWTLAEFDAEFELMAKVIEQAEIQRKASEAQAAVDFENRVANLMHGSTNRERVIAWLMDAESANGDFEYFAYTQGLPYRYFAQTSSVQ
jgi:hypothetical protein